MTLKALLYAYVLGGITFIPLIIFCLIYFTIYTSVQVGDSDISKNARGELERTKPISDTPDEIVTVDTNDMPKARKGWLTMRRTFEESVNGGGYVTLVRSFLDARSKDPKRSRPKDMWYVALKGKILFLYEDESMTECDAAVELGGHDVVIFPEGLADGELFTRRNAICLKPKVPPVDKSMPSVTKDMKLENIHVDEKIEEAGGNFGKLEMEREVVIEEEKKHESATEEALNLPMPWFIFVRTNIEMEDWYLSLIHASDHAANSPTLTPLQGIFKPSDMSHLVATLDEQPDVIPMRWLNALIGRLFFSYYRTAVLEEEIIRRLMKKLSKVKRPAFLTDIVVTEVSVGNKAPTFSKPMLKELTREGDASMEVHLQYKGEVRVTVEATATINLGARFKSYTVKLVLAAVLKELEGNLLVKVKRPPSNRIWYAFTQTPRMVLEVEPIVSDRQITWGMILSTIEARLKEIIQESVVMPNMDDIAFFSSSDYNHRGGIWPDASRRAKPPSSVSQSHIDDNVLIPEIPGATSFEAEPLPLRDTLSTEDMTLESVPLESVPVIRSATLDPPSAPFPKRRNWFAKVQGDEVTTFDSDSFRETVDAHRRAADEQCSGLPEADNTAALTSEPVNDGLRVHTSDIELEADVEAPTVQAMTTPPSVRPSSSQNSLSSLSREQSYKSPVTNEPSTPYSFASVPSTPHYENRSPSSTAASTPSKVTASSFLSQLKSRAADKEALSKSAKEAIRKWGVNWGGLRRDNVESGGSEDMSDHGSGDSRPRVERNSSFSQKTRASYAEVRAAVAERKDRESGISDISTPILIPETGKGKGRAVDDFSSKSQPVSPSSINIHPTSSSQSQSEQRPDALEVGRQPISRSSSSSRTSTKSDTTVEDTTVPILPPPVIHTTQPGLAKTMTIPGIHASHRGDVMSLGYVAPPPPSPLENKLKAPGIQSVYRLWKSPGSVDASQRPKSQQPITAESHTDDDNGDQDSLSSFSPPSDGRSTPPPRLGPPPPLPPRSIPTATALSRPPLDPLLRSPESVHSAHSASDSLKSIATKDANQRMSLDQLQSPSEVNAQEEETNTNHAKEGSQILTESSRAQSPPGSLIPVPG